MRGIKKYLSLATFAALTVTGVHAETGTNIGVCNKGKTMILVYVNHHAPAKGKDIYVNEGPWAVDPNECGVVYKQELSYPAFISILHQKGNSNIWEDVTARLTSDTSSRIFTDLDPTRTRFCVPTDHRREFHYTGTERQLKLCQKDTQYLLNYHYLFGPLDENDDEADREVQRYTLDVNADTQRIHGYVGRSGW